MTAPVAIGVGNAILASLTVLVALVGALAAVVLLWRVLQPILEIDRYARQIAGAAEDIQRNLDGVEELRRTRELASAFPNVVIAYAEGARS